MNILHVNKDFSGTGAQRVSLTILEHTPGQRKLYVADRKGLRNERFIAQMRAAGVEPVFMDGLLNSRSWLLPVAVVRIASLIRRERIDVVHSHSLIAGLAARLAGLIVGTRCLHTFHGAPSRRYSRLAFFVCLVVERLLAFATDVVIFNTAYQMRLLRQGPKRATVIHNYLPPRQHASRTKPPSSPARILFLARFEFQKHPEFFVRLAHSLRGAPMQFRMVGGGGLEERVRSLNSVLGAGVEVLPFAEDPAEHLEWADVVVLCSRYESLPLVIGEALSHGCGVVCSGVDGLDEVWGAAVTFFEEGSIAAAGAALRTALHPMPEREPARAEVLQRLGLDTFVAAHRRVYAELASPGRTLQLGGG